MKATWKYALLAFAVVLASCQLVAGLVDLEPGPGAPGLEFCSGPASACVVVPRGWLGPVVLYEGAPAAPTPACPSDYQTKAFEGSVRSADPAECSCKCEARPLSQSCGKVTVALFKGKDCGLDLPPITTPWDAGCNPVSGTYNSAQVAQAPSPDVQCLPATDFVDANPDPVASNVARACLGGQLPQGTCKTGAVCAPFPSASFDRARRLCIYQTFEKVAPACPPDTPLQTLTVDYDDDGFSDSRGCSCSCDASIPFGSCGGSVDFCGKGSGPDCSGCLQRQTDDPTCASQSLTRVAYTVGSVDASCVQTKQVVGAYDAGSGAAFCCVSLP